jgi:hypothetical protein
MVLPGLKLLVICSNNYYYIYESKFLKRFLININVNNDSRNPKIIKNIFPKNELSGYTPIIINKIPIIKIIVGNLFNN